MNATEVTHETGAGSRVGLERWWSDRAPEVRAQAVRVLWAVTWLGLLAGYVVDRRAWLAVVAFSGAHALAFGALHGWRLARFPVQVRVAYAAWVALGTLVPGLTVLMHVTTVGLATNLAFGYCPLARMLSLLPWNASEPLSWSLVVRTATTPPVPGRFVPRPARAASGSVR